MTVPATKRSLRSLLVMCVSPCRYKRRSGDGRAADTRDRDGEAGGAERDGDGLGEEEDEDGAGGGVAICFSAATSVVRRADSASYHMRWRLTTWSTAGCSASTSCRDKDMAVLVSWLSCCFVWLWR